ncbi:KxYKxGKxW signal peptide domain-containing protein [Lacticaseibacillus pabuli]|uniref:KxYKxGKxW signal peptide domain-containing protein n=1 Tax=Lacticaseibacillus pabuli TaxID=3025672 RepID=A0ABY7WVK7_9LACO|nr:KxYKxGKxW signal peptide domain-containing protein [Lacticaseibacillus sp. KACC 23028]WDF83002.1 KxYKxGKxW signal peptide domain-containing protein [Lacticaseibacillus sp. KACC 23028]
MNKHNARDTREVRWHYKMYKAGKRWLFAGMMLIGVGTGLMLGGQQAAAETASPPDAPAATTVSAADPPTEPVAETVAPTGQAQDTNVADESQTNPTVTDAPAEEAAVVETTPGENAVIEVSGASAEEQVVKEDEADGNLEPSGDAHTKKDGTVKLTDGAHQQGGATYTDPIDLQSDFELHGEIDLGQRDEQKHTKRDGEGDWVSVLFTDVDHPDGDAFGWRAVSSFDDDKYERQHRFHVDDPYGAFVYKSEQHPLDAYVPGKRDKARLQEIFDPQPDRWGTLDIYYQGATSELKVILQTFDDGFFGVKQLDKQEWKRNVGDWAHNMNGAVLTINGHTGPVANRLQFHLTQLCYTPARELATVNVEYRRTDDTLISIGTAKYPDGPKRGNRYETSPLPEEGIPAHYYLSWIDPDGLPENGILERAGDNGTVRYYYAPFQQAAVSFVDDTTNMLLEKIEDLFGKPNAAADFSSASKIQDYTTKGYALVSDETADGITFDDDETSTQTFTVHLQHQYVTVTTDDPHDADPSELTKTVSRTIHYVDAGTSDAVAQDVIQSVIFTRQGRESLVDKQIIYDPWTGTQHLVAVQSPLVDGYATDEWVIPAIEIGPESTEQWVEYYALAPLDVPPVHQERVQVGQPIAVGPARLADGIWVRGEVDVPLFVNPTDTDPGVPATPITPPGDGGSGPSDPIGGQPGVPAEKPVDHNAGGVEPPEDAEDDFGEPHERIHVTVKTVPRVTMRRAVTQRQWRRGGQLAATRTDSSLVIGTGVDGWYHRSGMFVANQHGTIFPKTGEHKQRVLSAVGLALALLISSIGLTVGVGDKKHS